MPFRNARTHFEDILDSIALIELFIGDLNYRQYEADQKTKSAVERQLQIITEAAYRLGSEADVLCPGPDWKGWMGMGNLLRHGYHKIDDAVVWETVKNDMQALREAVLKTFAAPDEQNER